VTNSSLRPPSTRVRQWRLPSACATVTTYPQWRLVAADAVGISHARSTSAHRSCVARGSGDDAGKRQGRDSACEFRCSTSRTSGSGCAGSPLRGAVARGDGTHYQPQHRASDGAYRAKHSSLEQPVLGRISAPSFRCRALGLMAGNRCVGGGPAGRPPAGPRPSRLHLESTFRHRTAAPRPGRRSAMRAVCAAPKS
jgi:hypothetical protein